jgi:multicomponent Na+:H+ antiporter subunit C
MELVMIFVIGVLFSVATYLVLTRSLLRVILGTVIYSHAAHLLILTMAQLKRGAPPILNDNTTQYTDPLPQALILTAIVISFGVTAFVLVLAYRAYKKIGAEDVEQLRGTIDE